MTEPSNITAWRALLPVGLGTGLSLIGDSSLYTVLPTHAPDAGVPLASVGILLSANRFIRLILNGPTGLAYDRWRHRPLFVTALLFGACSTAVYALARGFWPLLAGRLLWGLAWAGIWVGGNTIILDISKGQSRGRWVGIYQISFFLGASGGAVIGGLLTDWLGYHLAMGIGAGLTFLGALIAMFFLPETSRIECDSPEKGEAPVKLPGSKPSRRAELVSAIVLMGVNRLVLAGVLSSTFALLLLEKIGPCVEIAGRSYGVASITGIGLGTSYLVSMVSAPIMGALSDRLRNRWQAAAGGLVPGMAGFCLLALGSPLSILFGLPLSAFAGGSNQGLSTAIVGDLSDEGQRGGRMGILFTSGDLASAIGPPLAYALIPFLGLEGLYLMNGVFLAIMILIAVQWSRTDSIYSMPR